MLTNDTEAAPSPSSGRHSTMRSVEWLGQTIASVCWMTSVFVYGLSSAGDWLQLAAASAWLAANLAALRAAR